MRNLRRASFEEFVGWYLRRETRKGNRPPNSGMAVELEAEMKRVHSGKLRPWFPRADWRVVELTELHEILSLVCVDGIETRRNELLGLPQEPNRRILIRAIENARRNQYFDNSNVARENPVEYSKRQRKIDEFRCEWPNLNGEERSVLCGLNSGELHENPAGTYYIDDGFGRLLAFGYLVLYEGRRFTPVEAFLALE
jgi:hypothetical protein